MSHPGAITDAMTDGMGHRLPARSPHAEGAAAGEGIQLPSLRPDSEIADVGTEALGGCADCGQVRTRAGELRHARYCSQSLDPHHPQVQRW